MMDIIRRPRRRATSETEGFLEATMARFHDAETALHNGDATPLRPWSHTDPVTLFGAAMGERWARSNPSSIGSSRPSRTAPQPSMDHRRWRQR
jgi:hypothetical protein